MIVTGLGVWLLMGIAAAPESKAAAKPPAGDVVLRHQMIIRSIRIRPNRANQSIPIAWREARGVQCVPIKAIAGAALHGPNNVDFILKDRRRIRARLNSACPALDYYQGFYLAPGEDGMLCAARDFVRSRMGRECGIERFRMLVPKRPRKIVAANRSQ